MPDDGDVACNEADYWLFVGFEFSLAAAQHLDGRINQKSSKEINDPVETIDQFSSHHDH